MSFRSTPAFTVATVGFAIFTDQFLFAVITPALPFIVKERLQLPPQHVKFAISASLASFSIASMATLVFVALSGCPRAWRKWVYLAGLGILVAATVLFYTAAGLPMLLTARSLQGVSGSLVWVVGMGMLYDAVGPAALGVSMGTVFGIGTAGALIAPAIGGALYHAAGIYGLFAVSMAVLLVDLVLRLLLKTGPSKPQPARQSDTPRPHRSSQTAVEEGIPDERTPLRPVEPQPISAEPTFQGPRPAKSSIIETLRHTATWTSLAAIAMQALILGFIDAAFPLRLNQLFGFDSLQCGLMLLPVSVATALLSPVAGWAADRYGPRLPATIGCIITAASVALFGAPLPESRSGAIGLLVVYLGICGVGLTVLDMPAFVTSVRLLHDLHSSEPDVYGAEVPQVEQQGALLAVYSLGLILGPSITVLGDYGVSFAVISWSISGLMVIVASCSWATLR